MTGTDWPRKTTGECVCASLFFCWSNKVICRSCVSRFGLACLLASGSALGLRVLGLLRGLRASSVSQSSHGRPCSHRISITFIHNFIHISFLSTCRSKAFYCYSSAVMKIMMGHMDEASARLLAVPELLRRSKKINGRPLPFDRCVAQIDVN